MHPAVHVTLPGHQVAQAPIRARETVNGFLRRTGWSTDKLPTICVLNGRPLMRQDWGRYRLRKKDRLAFMSKPLGGGSAQGKQIAGLVAMIALVALAPYVAGPMAAAFFGGSAIAQSVIGAAFVAGGAFAINTLIAPKAGGQDDDPGQIYSFGTQSNSARVLQTIPVSYGRVKRAPDYAAVPWSEFIGNEQFLHIVLVDGLGKYERHQILVDDTVLWDSGTGINSEFSGVSIDFYEPGEEITSFPLNVATAAEVSGQELPDDLEWVGGFIANAAGTTARHLAIDIVFPGGLYQVNSSGKLSPVFVPVTAQYRPVNDLGAPTGAGSWTVLFTQVFGGQTKKPKRFSRKVAVSAGRYEVRLRRNNDASTDSNIVDGVAWAGLRAYLTGPQSFPGVSVTAITMRATQQLTSAAAQRMSVISTRILPVWNGSAWVEQATRSPAWAMWDIATNEDYGAKRAISKVDIQSVLALDAGATTRGDCFDFTFSSAMGVPEALDTALRVTRAKHRWAGDVLTLVRDEWRDVPSMMLTDQEIVRGSLSVDYLMQPEDSADAVILEYVDETVWQPAEVQVPTDYAADYPVRIQLPGIVQRDQAYREAQFLYRQSQYRRVRPTLETEHDGRLVSMGDHLLVQSDIPGAWGAAGKVVGEDEGALTLEPAPAWAESGQHYISIRTKFGAPFGPVKCRRGETDADCILYPTDLALVETQQETTLAEVLARMPGAEHPSFAHGLGTAWQRRCIAMTGAPSGDRVQLVLVVDDERVHESSGSPDALPALPTLRLPRAPVVGGLVAKIEQGLIEPALSASWWPATGALYYVAQVSYDDGDTWETLAESRDAEATWVVEPRALKLRVAAVGSSKGPWQTIDVAAPDITYEMVEVTVSNFEASLRAEFERVAGEQQDYFEKLSDALAMVQADISARTYSTYVDERTSRVAAIAGVRSEFYEQLLLAVGPDSALAAQVTALSVQVGDVEASLTISGVARAGWGTATVAYDIAAKVEDDGEFYSSGLRVGLVPDGMGGYTGAVYVVADQFVVGNAAGDVFTPMFSISGGNAYLDGNFIATGSIKGLSIGAEEISTNKLTINGVTTDRIAPWAVSNIGQATAVKVGSVTAFSTAYDIITYTITRTSGTVAIIGLSFDALGWVGVNSCVIELQRVSGSTVKIRSYVFDIPAGGVRYFYFEHMDTVSVSGSVTYKARLTGAAYRNVFDVIALKVDERLR